MKKLLIPISLIVVVALSSCDLLTFKDSINNNPNQPSEASASQLLANAMLSLPGLSSSPTIGGEPTGEFLAQYLSETQYVGGTLYPEGGTSFYSWYETPLINLQIAQSNAKTANQVAVAKILKAYYFWSVTDRWGDIPYSDALRGIDNYTPSYDTQQVVYDSLFASLKEAGSQIETSGTLDGDIIYQGDMAKWRRFNNTLRLLMALRLSQVDPQRGEQEFNAALDDGIMTSNDDSFIFHNLPDANNQSYWYGQIVDPPTREWWALSEGLVSLMKPVDDPRLSIYGNEAREGGGYVGLKFGTEDEDSIGTERFSLLGSDIYAQDAPVYLVTYAEALFAKAEAAELGWIPEDPAANYNSAIENSILQWTGSTDGVSDFMSQPEVAFNPSDAIEQIVTQRYVHLFMNGYEAWAVWRRTGYPDIMVHPRGREVPLRQSYTEDEKLNNTQNYHKAIDRQFNGKNSIYGRLWWDVE